jgi:carbon monoxide dehydrogenase subunit G
MDVPRVVPCVPGATLLSSESEDRWLAELAVALGPVAMTFDAQITRESVDDAAGSIRLVVRAKEKKGRGAATAEVDSRVEETGEGTRVAVATSLRLQGAVARVGRSEIVEEVSQQMTDAFASCLKAKLSSEAAAGAPAPAPKLRITLRAIVAGLWRAIARRRG